MKRARYPFYCWMNRVIETSCAQQVSKPGLSAPVTRDLTTRPQCHSEGSNWY